MAVVELVGGAGAGVASSIEGASASIDPAALIPGAQVGDRAVICWSRHRTGGTTVQWTTPPGWTRPFATGSGAATRVTEIYWRTLDGTANDVWTGTHGFPSDHSMWVGVLRGINPTADVFTVASTGTRLTVDAAAGGTALWWFFPSDGDPAPDAVAPATRAWYSDPIVAGAAAGMFVAEGLPGGPVASGVPERPQATSQLVYAMSFQPAEVPADPPPPTPAPSGAAGGYGTTAYGTGVYGAGAGGGGGGGGDETGAGHGRTADLIIATAVGHKVVAHSGAATATLGPTATGAAHRAGAGESATVSTSSAAGEAPVAGGIGADTSLVIAAAAGRRTAAATGTGTVAVPLIASAAGVKTGKGTGRPTASIVGQATAQERDEGWARARPVFTATASGRKHARARSTWPTPAVAWSRGAATKAGAGSHGQVVRGRAFGKAIYGRGDVPIGGPALGVPIASAVGHKRALATGHVTPVAPWWAGYALARTATGLIIEGGYIGAYGTKRSAYDATKLGLVIPTAVGHKRGLATVDIVGVSTSFGSIIEGQALPVAIVMGVDDITVVVSVDDTGAIIGVDDITAAISADTTMALVGADDTTATIGADDAITREPR